MTPGSSVCRFVALGNGRYAVQLLQVDDQNRFERGPGKLAAVTTSMEATVAAMRLLTGHCWDRPRVMSTDEGLVVNREGADT